MNLPGKGFMYKLFFDSRHKRRLSALNSHFSARLMRNSTSCLPSLRSMIASQSTCHRYDSCRFTGIMTYLHQAEIQAVIRTKQSFRPAIPALQAVRVAPRQTSIFFSTCLCLLLIVPTLAEASSYRYKMNDGSVLFTDIRMSSKKAKSGQLDSLGQRANYQGSYGCLLYTSPSPRDATLSRMPSSA